MTLSKHHIAAARQEINDCELRASARCNLGRDLRLLASHPLGSRVGQL